MLPSRRCRCLPPFDVWLAELRTEAEARGIRPEVLDRALTGIEPVAQILERDRTQAEFTLQSRRLPAPPAPAAHRAHRARRCTAGTARWSSASARRTASIPRLLISVWGLESEFGRFAGVRPTVPTLATLAYDPRRGAMFRTELFNALEIVNRGDIELERLKGSWAGALGQPQFMPSSYLRYAQDFDGDGRRDIWTRRPTSSPRLPITSSSTAGRRGGRGAARSSCRRRPRKPWPRCRFAPRAAAPAGR